jgi:hypothetical protein
MAQPIKMGGFIRKIRLAGLLLADIMVLQGKIRKQKQMRVKPKEVLLNLPVALLFDEPWEIASFAANINAILHGKIRLKAEELGLLGGRYVGLFYLQRNNESQEIHDEFMRLIEEEEMNNHDHSFIPTSTIPPLASEDQ